MFWVPGIKVVATALCSVLLSEIGCMVLKWADKNYQLMHLIHNLIGNWDIAFLVKQAAPGVFSAHIELLASAGIYVASVSVVACGVAVGVKAYWKNNYLATGIENINFSNQQNLVAINHDLEDDLNHDLDEELQEKANNPILYQLNAGKNILNHNKFDVLSHFPLTQQEPNAKSDLFSRNLFS